MVVEDSDKKGSQKTHCCIRVDQVQSQLQSIHRWSINNRVISLGEITVMQPCGCLCDQGRHSSSAWRLSADFSAGWRPELGEPATRRRKPRALWVFTADSFKFPSSFFKWRRNPPISLLSLQRDEMPFVHWMVNKNYDEDNDKEKENTIIFIVLVLLWLVLFLSVEKALFMFLFVYDWSLLQEKRWRTHPTSVSEKGEIFVACSPLHSFLHRVLVRGSDWRHDNL